jgi:hypothetical protein
MPLFKRIIGACLALLLWFCAARPAVADIPAWLPRYELDMQMHLAEHNVQVRQRVTWTNRHQRPVNELVFNAHSHFEVAKADLPLAAKTLELLRLTPSFGIEVAPPPFQIKQITHGEAALDYHYYDAFAWNKRQKLPPEQQQELTPDEKGSVLVVSLPKPVGKDDSVTIVIEFTFRLPQKQGRWGQWNGVTFLSNWLPVVAVHDDDHGWQPTPYIPWHQPFFNEAGLYSGRVTLPCDQVIACSTSILEEKDLGDGTKQIELTPRATRDFAFLCSARYQEVVGHVGSIKVRCVALPEHQYYAKVAVQAACEAIPYYNQWIGPYPYPEFTIAESYFGWLGNECGGLVMIENRVFGMPELGHAYVEYLVTHELCHQWWYNLIGTNGYCETWMDEAMATHFSHRVIDKKHGRNNALLEYPKWLSWLPNIHREDYRFYGYYGTLGRGEAKATVLEMQEFGHLVNLLSMCYDRGGKIVGMIENRLGEAAFHEFSHVIYTKYQFRILRVRDYQHELEEFTGQKWDQFFDQWLYSAGLVDWAVEKVKVEPVRQAVSGPQQASFLAVLHDRHASSYKVTVLLHQKADYNEATVLGFCLDGGEGYQIRVPIEPAVPVVDLDDPPAHIESLPGNQVRVEIVLPCKPTQISVDPDQVLVDRNPANNHWKTPIRWRVTPFNNLLEETDVTAAYDRWNVTVGPGIFFPAYEDPWYTRSSLVGLRGSLYRTQEFDGGGYLAYRTDNRDLVVGADALWNHWPWSHTQVGLNVERSLTSIGNDDDRHADRAVVFGRYVMKYGSSLYLPPMEYVEAFATIQDYPLPQPSPPQTPCAEQFNHQTAVGVHYHLDYLTPYWDPEAGIRVDATYASGIPILGEHQAFNRVDGQVSYVWGLRDVLGPLSATRLAFRAYGAAGLPNHGDYFTLGGGNLLRGYSQDARQGSMVWVGSIEWRIPIVRNVTWDCCDHVAGIRNVYVAPFYDVGDAYVCGHSQGPVAHALGLGLRVDTALFSFVERAMLRFDVAKTVNDSTGVQFWFGVGVPW